MLPPGRYDSHVHVQHGADIRPEKFRAGLKAAGIAGCALFSEDPDPAGTLAPKPAPPEEAIDNLFRWIDGAENIFPFYWINPTAPEACDLVDLALSKGIMGFKVLPGTFYPGDPRALPVYRKIAHLGLICVFHAGMDVAFPPPCPCSPERIARALPAFDGSPVVAAHFGGYMMWQEALSAYKGTGIYLDTSYSHSRVIMPLARELVQMAGTDHLLFGSDAPWSDPAREAMAVHCLGLSPEEEKMVFCDNARRLLGLNLS